MHYIPEYSNTYKKQISRYSYKINYIKLLIRNTKWICNAFV